MKKQFSFGYRSLLKYCLLITLICTSIGCSVQASNVTSISAEQLLTEIQQGTEILILDVRSTAEYESGHIPGAVNIDYRSLPDRLTEIENFAETKESIVVYCERGFRAAIAEEALQEAGFNSVLQLEGDMIGWRENQFPVTVP